MPVSRRFTGCRHRRNTIRSGSMGAAPYCAEVRKGCRYRCSPAVDSRTMSSGSSSSCRDAVQLP